MQPSYDADDFMRRGFFGSLIGFRKRASSKTEPAQQLAPKFVPSSQHHHHHHSNVPCSSAPEPVGPSSVPIHQVPVDHHHQLQPPPPPPPPPLHRLPEEQVPLHDHFGLPQNRTEFDIYQEIVNEAELIECSPINTPDFSGPTTPQPPFYQSPPPPPPVLHQPALFAQPPPHVLMPQGPSEMMHHQYHMVMSPIAPHPIPVDTNGVPLGTQCPMAPPPYSSFAPQSSSSQMSQQPQTTQMPNLPFDVKREIQEHLVLGKQQLSIEDIVKLVVVALKDSQIEEPREEESPEEILRRKRIQNNLAAARYRKRQREAKESAEQELGELTRRNDELRDQVLQMERQIDELKQAVLGRQ